MPTISVFIEGFAALAAGLAIGAVYFVTLRWNTHLYATGGAARALLIQVLRFAGLGAALAVIAKFGAFALLAATAGVLLARFVVLSRPEAVA